MPSIKIGAASWHDIASFYPSGCRAPGARLKFYSTEFPLVEVDTSYYAIPRLKSVATWAEHTPADFTFDVKAFRLLTTHQTAPRVLSPEAREALPSNLADKGTIYYRQTPASVKDMVWAEFEAVLDLLSGVGKLGVVLFQFPFWFMPKRESFSHIDECRERLSKYRLAVEFRNRYWLDDDNLEETLSFLRRNGLSFVAVDEPQGFNSSVPPLADVTAEVAIVRFHGRNRDTWEKKGLKSSQERFDYYYSRGEMEEWAPKIAVMAQQAREMHVIINTNNQDQAIANARLAAEVLGDGKSPPRTLL